MDLSCFVQSSHSLASRTLLQGTSGRTTTRALAEAERLEPVPQPTKHLVRAQTERPEPALSRFFALSE